MLNQGVPFAHAPLRFMLLVMCLTGVYWTGALAAFLAVAHRPDFLQLFLTFRVRHDALRVPFSDPLATLVNSLPVSAAKCSRFSRDYLAARSRTKL